jgi:hypothetical protein
VNNPKLGCNRKQCYQSGTGNKKEVGDLRVAETAISKISG